MISFHPHNGAEHGRCTSLAVLTIIFPLFLQRQVAGEVQAPTHDRSVNQIAMMLAIMGLSLSYYSAKQMTEKVNHKPAPWRCANVRGVQKRQSQIEDVQMLKIQTHPSITSRDYTHTTGLLLRSSLALVYLNGPGRGCVLSFNSWLDACIRESVSSAVGSKPELHSET